jgi:hypothetical protein
MKLRGRGVFPAIRLIAIGLLLAGQAALGQTVTATLTGTVVDASGASVPEANVTLTNTLSGNVRKTVTNAAGYYALPAIPAGTYSVIVEAKGFQRSEVKDFALNSADERKIDVTMTVGAVSETISVTASAEQVAVSSGEKAQVLDTQILQNVAVVGRSAAEFLKVLPGMTQTGNGVTNAPGYSGEVIGINGNGNAGKQSALGNFSANGTPTASMEIMSDGAHVSDPGCNCATPVNPNAEMIQEVKVLQAAFSAENSYGPVVINTTTKAGGSAFHGEGYLSARNYVLNANDASSNAKGLNLSGAQAAPRPQNRYYFPGGNIGGPVRLPHFNKNRDKMFFFSGFEYFYQALNANPVLAVVPTAAMKAGDFSQASINALNPAAGVGGGIKPPNAATYPNGQVPVNLMNPIGIALANLFPAPNANPFSTGGYNFVEQVPFQQNGWQMVHRIDYSFSDNTKLFVRYYHQQEAQNFPINLWAQASDQVPYPSVIVGNNHSESVAVNLTHVFNPTLTNEFVVNYTYVGFPNSYVNQAAAKMATYNFNFAGAFHNGDPYLPNVNIGGVALLQSMGGVDVAYPYYANKPLSSTGDNVIKSWRTHTIRIGFWGEYYGNYQPSNSAANGTITTASNDPTGSGNPFADLFLGNVSAYTQQNHNAPAKNESTIFEGYVQDSWKVNRRLTLDFGVRIQHDPESTDLYHLGHAVWVPSTWSNNPTAVLPGLQWYARDPSIGNPGYPTRGAYFAPRFGEAYDLFGTGKTVLRGGIGEYRYRGPTGNIGGSIVNGSYAFNLPNSNGSTLALIPTLPVPSFTGQNASTGNLANQNSSQLSMTWTYDFTISQQLPWNATIEVAYVGTKARHLAESAFHNVNIVPFGAMLATPTANNQLFRPYPNYQDITINEFDAPSDYNALQVTWRRQGARYSIGGNYTFSKVLGIVNQADPYNPANDYGPLAFDRRSSFNLNYVLKLGSPVHEKVLAGVINDWSISGIVQYQTGAFLQAGGALGLTLPAGYVSGGAVGITGTPNMAAFPVLTCDPRSNLGPNQYLNPSCFALPTPGHDGSIIEPEAFGPGYFNMDTSLFKTFKMGEKRSIQFRAEGFNFLNHPNPTFGLDNNLSLAFNLAGQQTNALFGTATTKTDHRILQFAVKFYF